MPVVPSIHSKTAPRTSSTERHGRRLSFSDPRHLRRERADLRLTADLQGAQARPRHADRRKACRAADAAGRPRLDPRQEAQRVDDESQGAPACARPCRARLQRRRARSALVADFTQLTTWSGTAYVAVVADAYSRLCLGWSVRADKTVELMLEALASSATRPADRAASSSLSPAKGAWRHSAVFRCAVAMTAPSPRVGGRSSRLRCTRCAETGHSHESGSRSTDPASRHER